MRGQGRLDMYLTKRAEKQESSQNIRGTQSQKDHQVFSAKKVEKGTEVLTKSGFYIYSGKKENNIQMKDQKASHTPTKEPIIRKSSVDYQKSSLLSTPHFDKRPTQLSKTKLTPQSQLLNSSSKILEQKKVQLEGNSSDTEQLNDSTLNIEVCQKNSITCPQYILISPFDRLDSELLQSKLEQLMTECTKRRVLEFIKMQTLQAGQFKNLSNVEKIHDDQFWCISLQKIIELLLTKQQLISGGIRTLPYSEFPETVELTRLQIFLLVASMFLAIIPSQSYTNQTSFYQLMTIKGTDEKDKQKPPVRLQKLKCVINYLKFMSEHEEIYQEKVTFQRAISYDKEYLSEQNTVPLGKVEVSTGKIEDGYGIGAMVDFANAAVGGGFLGNGCAQEEILFSIFPELSVIKLICEDLRQEQALVIRGARRFNQYEGYSYNFKYKGTTTAAPTANSVIVAVDAIDFTRGLLTKSSQFSKKFILRELHKMFVGVERARSFSPQKLQALYTGRWGCGIYGADEYLKFCIQWIICSHLQMHMIFMTADEDSRRKLMLLVRNLETRSASELLAVILQYGKQGRYGISLLNYFKDYS